MLKKIEIKGLFNQFDYDIELKPEGLTILTGPNGYGKTTILKIIHAFATKNVTFFFQLPFKEIVLTQEQDEIRLLKGEVDILEIRVGGKILTFHKKAEFIPEYLKYLLEKWGLSQIKETLWRDQETKQVYRSEHLINQLIDNNPEIQAKYYAEQQIPDWLDVYFIKEHRLIRRGAVFLRIRDSAEEISGSFSNIIEEAAQELSKYIRDVQAKAAEISQTIDSSFPRRLFDETEVVSHDDFNTRYEGIKAKRKTLSLYGLATTQPEDNHTLFKPENAKALLVYLNDTEQKSAIYNKLLQEIELFTTILNEKQLVSKCVQISPEFGFRFKTHDNQELPLTDLSSGEQHEVMLLYELLFKVKPNTLVLIDEPELSLHVAWQRRFLDDLLKISELRKVTAIVATHSPQIIGNKWDLEVDLYDLTMLTEEVSK